MNIYLNNAATGWPRAHNVIKAVSYMLEHQPSNSGRVSAESDTIIGECRKLVARLLDVSDPSRIILTVNATHALNLAIHGLNLGNNDHIITTVLEHNSVLRPVNHLREKYPGLRISVINLDNNGQLDYEKFSQALSAEPTVVIINHASNVTGHIYDVAGLFSDAKKAGAITVLDATQTTGAIPVSPMRLNADLVAFTGHKALHGPPGTGGLYVSPELELKQVYVGGTGIRSDMALHPPEMPLRLEAGTPNSPAIAGLHAALQWHEKKGNEYSKLTGKYIQRLYEELSEIRGVSIFDKNSDVDRVGVISFKIEGWSVEETGYILAESFGIICRTGLHCAPLIHKAIGSAPEGTVRFSVSGFNTDEDIMCAIKAIRKLSS
ncbi:MAG: aminotransferase class V-fold PLP-dependent enzyme [Candidatus Latescibacteria bacterium]|nr:aminotransferase class V-fold PLP-dependent enzyme [Candidatus Latescibacterota bacterium]